jgi:hypothetical protein
VSKGEGGTRPSPPPTEQGSHRGVTRHAIAVNLHLDQRPLLAPEQMYGYSYCTHMDRQLLKDTPYELNCASSGQP